MATFVVSVMVYHSPDPDVSIMLLDPLDSAKWKVVVTLSK
jgi:hypothetical protein